MLLSRSEPVASVHEDIDVNVVTAFQLLGTTILNSVPRYIDSHPHKNMYLPSVNDAAGIMDILRRLRDSNKSFSAKFTRLSDSQKTSFRDVLCQKLSSHNLVLNEADKKFLKSLAMFQVLPHSGSHKSSRLSSIDEVMIGAYCWRTELHVQQPVLDLRDGQIRTLVKKLGGVEVVDDFHILKFCVLPNITTAVFGARSVTETMCNLCNHFQKELETNQDDILTAVRFVRFVSKQSGELATAGDLYDDTEPIIAQLFEGLDLFPRGTFADEKFRPRLRRLGLRGVDSVKIDHVIDRARYLDDNSRAPELDNVRKAMMALMNRRLDLLRESRKLRQLKWICPLRRRPDNYPSSMSFVSEAQRPGDVCLQCYAYLIGSHKVTVETENIQPLAEYFGWMNGPKVADVVNHLINVIDWYTAEERNADDVMTARSLCDQIYKHLEQCLQNDSSLSSDVERLGNVACVFIENRFVLPRICAFNSALVCQFFPAVATIPEIMASNFKKLLQTVGVRDQFVVDDYIFMLDNIRMEVGDSPASQDTLAKISCVASELHICVNNLEYSPPNLRICLPDTDGILRPTSELCYSDIVSTALIAKHDLHTCHPIVSQVVAVGLGVKSAKELILGQHISGMCFGQREELVTRIKRILTGYPFDVGILYELLQNADDAGATKLHFILDERQLSTQHVFDESWNHIIGPALCVFNDKPFTEKDIKGIQNLGQGGKAEDSLKIGKFGIGFNCVYHITDVPTFLTSVNSKRVLCAFDPTCKHMSMSTEQSPGCMIDVTDDIIQSYPDIFDAYLKEEYGEIEGTVFRFPLRKNPSTSRETADDEKLIANKPVSCDEINKLFSDFKECCHECLLFLRNVTQISLRRVVSNDAEKSVRDVFVVNAKVPESKSQKYATFCNQLSAVAADLAEGHLKVRNIQKREHCFRVTTTDGEDTEKHWLVIRRLGLENRTKENLPETLLTMDDKYELKYVPRADVAYMLNCTERALCRLFCFLPLPVKHRLPVHVNGHFVLEYENRRNLWNWADGGHKADWNVCILEGVVAPAYLRLLQEVKDDLPSPVTHKNLKQYLDVFPNVMQEENMMYMKRLSFALYALISAHDAELLPVYSNRIPLTLENLNWVAPCSRTKHILSPCFVSFDMACKEEVPDTAVVTPKSADNVLTTKHPKESEILREKLVACGFQLIISSFSALYQNFKKAGVDVIESTPKNVLTFYGTQYKLKAAKCNLSDTAFQNIKNLKIVIRYCRKDEKHLRIRLLHTPFLLTADECLQTFDPDDRKFVCKYQAIAPKCASDFVYQDVVRILELNPIRDICLCKNFGLLQFSEALPELLPVDVFRRTIHRVDDMVPVNRLFDYMLVKPASQTDAEIDDIAAAMGWLKEVWKFLASELHSKTRRIMKYYFDKTHKSKQKPAKAEHKRRFVAAQLAAVNYNQWCLLPVMTVGGDRVLVPVEKMPGVVHEEEIKRSVRPEVYGVFEQLNIPTFDQEVFDGQRGTELQWIAETYASLPNNVAASVVKSFCVFDYSHIRLESAQSEELATFFADHLTSWKDIPEAVQTLRRLYLFKDVSERVVRLCDFEECSVMSEEVPKIGLFDDCQAWTDAMNRTRRAVILEHNSRLEELALHLQCKKLTPVLFYVNYAFDYFQEMTEEARMVHLYYLCFNLMRLKKCNHQHKDEEAHQSDCEYWILRTALRRLPFLPTSDGSGFEVASFFYDPRVNLFKSMVDESFFPRMYFPERTREWLDFLCECGLVNEVTENKLLKFARQLSRSSGQTLNGDSKSCERVGELATMILNELVRKFQDQSNRISNHFLNAFSQVSFIPLGTVGKKLRSLHPQAGFNDSTLTTVQLQGSAQFEDRSLLWTCCNILPSKVSKSFHQKQLQRLGVCVNPSVPDVITNLENVCNVCALVVGLQRQEDMRRKLVTVLARMFDYFTKNICAVERLQSIRCILIDYEHFVLPKQVVVNTNFEIRPYLFKFPQEFGQFTDLFGKLGVTQQPTPHHYAQVLATIHQNSRDSVLTPQESLAAVKAVSGVLLCLQERQSFAQLSELYLPSDDGKLYSSYNLMLRDNHSFAERLTGDFGLVFLLDFRQLTLRIPTEVAVELLRRLPGQIRPQLLSVAFKECLKASEGEETDVVDAEIVNEVASHLSSTEFRQGLYRLAVHVLRGLDELDETRVQQAKILLASLDSISVIQRHRITTYLDYVGKFPVMGQQERAKIRATSEAVCPYFVDEKTLYIGACSESSRDSLYATLAQVVNRMTNNLLTSVLHHVYVILRCERTTIEQYLDRVNITPCDFQV